MTPPSTLITSKCSHHIPQLTLLVHPKISNQNQSPCLSLVYKINEALNHHSYKYPKKKMILFLIFEILVIL